MIVYPLDADPTDADFLDLGDPGGLGGRVLDGSPRVTARIDFQGRGMMAGILEYTRGRIEITSPFTEHATILSGELTVTDADGRSHDYGPGDSYFVRQGEVITWEVKSDRVRKSFFSLTEDWQPS
ncbi:MAG: cupin domain-containing protein [Myxococcota bacterium]